MAVLRQALVFVDHLCEIGMLTLREFDLMELPIDNLNRRLQHRGPVWRAPVNAEVLRSIAILREVRRGALDPHRFCCASPS